MAKSEAQNTRDHEDNVIDHEDNVTDRKGLGGISRLLMIMIVVLYVIVAGFGYLVSDLSEDVEDNIAAEKALARDVRGLENEIVDLDETIRDALSLARRNNEDEPDLNNQAIIDALQAIARIEGVICGGMCPERGES